MTDEKASFTAVASATLRADNHTDESRTVDISADFNNFADTDAQVAALREIKAFVTAVRASGASAFNLSPRQDYE